MPIDCAFYYCKSLTSVDIPDNITNIGHYSFKGCTSIKSMKLPFVGVPFLGYIFGANRYENNADYVPSSLKSVVVSGIDKVRTGAFYNCSSITYIDLPNTITSIDAYAFYGCTALKSIKIPKTVVTIGTYAFYECKFIKSVNIPSNIIELGDFAFSGCKSLSRNEYSGAYYLGNEENPYIFLDYCVSTDLTQCKIYDGCRIIDRDAFLGCNKLSVLEIPDSVFAIGRNAFDGCSSLNYTVYNGACYLGNSSNCYLWLIKAKSNNITECVIHNDCKYIYSSAFYNCKELLSLAISDGVSHIFESAFEWCTSLSNVTIGGNINYVDFGIFSICDSLLSLTYNGTKEAWDSVVKNANWNWNSEITTIKCTDGEIYV